MGYADIEFNNIMGSSMKIYAANYPSIPAAVEKINETEIPGRDGVLHLRTGTFEQTEIPIEFNYIGKEELWNERWREAKKWLSATDVELRFADDAEHFYKISKVVLEANQRVSKRIGKFVAKFITKDGLSYMTSGKQQVDYAEVNFNPGIISKPVYIIAGEGLCVLTVNGKTMQVNVSDNIVINTEQMISYRLDDVSQNIMVKGDYEELYLQEGKNEISITNGFTCKIIPNWRCL